MDQHTIDKLTAILSRLQKSSDPTAKQAAVDLEAAINEVKAQAPGPGQRQPGQRPGQP